MLGKGPGKEYPKMAYKNLPFVQLAAGRCVSARKSLSRIARRLTFSSVAQAAVGGGPWLSCPKGPLEVCPPPL